MNKIVAFLQAFPRSQIFNDQGLHIWGVGLWTYFFITQWPAHWAIAVLVAILLSTAHEFWYDALLPGAAAGVGSPRSLGRLENWLGYMGGIALAVALHLVPIAGIVGFCLVVAGLLTAAIALEFGA